MRRNRTPNCRHWIALVRSPRGPPRVRRALFRELAWPTPGPPRAPPYLRGARRRCCTLAPAAGLLERDKSSVRPSQTPSRVRGPSLLRSRTCVLRRPRRRLPLHSGCSLPAQRPLFHKARPQPDGRAGGGAFPRAVGSLIVCRRDTMGPHFLPAPGSAPEIPLDCGPSPRPCPGGEPGAQRVFPVAQPQHRDLGRRCPPAAWPTLRPLGQLSPPGLPQRTAGQRGSCPRREGRFKERGRGV